MTEPGELAAYFGFTENEVKIFAWNMEWILKKQRRGMTGMV